MVRWGVVLAIGFLAPGFRAAAQEAVRWSNGTAQMVLYPRKEGSRLFLADVPLEEERTASWGATLDAVESALRRDLGPTKKPEGTRFYLFRDPARFAVFVRHYLPKVPAAEFADRHGLFLLRSGTSCVFLRLDAAVEETLRHEYVHVLLNHQVPGIPLWLDEGLACRYQSGEEKLRAPGSIRPEVLQRLEALRDMRQMGRAEYEAAWEMVDRLLDQHPQGQRLLREYLADLARDPRAEPLSRRLGFRLR